MQMCVVILIASVAVQVLLVYAHCLVASSFVGSMRYCKVLTLQFQRCNDVLLT
jgi:hypothetical protein